jgi:hypothetical protein
MIPQIELDRALARWKSRKMGLSEVPTPAPVPIAADPAIAYGAAHAYDDGPGASEDATVVRAVDVVEQELGAETSSGVIAIGDGDYEPQT